MKSSKDSHVTIFLLALSEAYYAKGDFEAAKRDISRALKINPQMKNLQLFELWNMVETGEFKTAKRFARQMNADSLSIENELQLIDWVENPQEDASTAVKLALESFPRMAILANSIDLWPDAVETAGAVWPEWAINPSTDLIAPVVPAE